MEYPIDHTEWSEDGSHRVNTVIMAPSSRRAESWCRAHGVNPRRVGIVTLDGHAVRGSFGPRLIVLDANEISDIDLWRVIAPCEPISIDYRSSDADLGVVGRPRYGLSWQEQARLRRSIAG